MGTLSYMERNPRRWYMYDEGLLLKTGESIVQVTAGHTDDDYGGYGDIKFFIRKDIYDNLIAGKYTLSITSDSAWIVVFDEHGNEIPCLVRGYFY